MKISCQITLSRSVSFSRLLITVANNLPKQLNLDDKMISIFQTSKVDTYHRMWQFMDANSETVLVESTKEGVEKVRNSKGKYAFMLESPYNAYQNQRKPCNTMQVGEPLDSKGYGIATPMGFHLR